MDDMSATYPNGALIYKALESRFVHRQYISASAYENAGKLRTNNAKIVVL